MQLVNSLEKLSPEGKIIQQLRRVAVVAAYKHFLPYLLGHLRDLDFEVQYHEGVANDNTDGMSRQAWLDDDDKSLKEGEVSRRRLHRVCCLTTVTI